MQNPNFDPRRMALVESAPPIPLAEMPQGQGAGRVDVTRYEGERIGLTASAAANSLLVLGEKYYQGWRATIDGKEVPIVPVNHVLRGVYLPAGDHRVEFVFDPTPFKIGKWLTFASFAIFIFMLGREWRGTRIKR